MKSLTDLKKKCVSGQKIKLVKSDIPYKFLNIERSIGKVQTNGFYMQTQEQIEQNKKGSWLDFPKAKDILFIDDNTFSIKTWPDNPENKETLIYKFI
jgi:hypothetical protein